GTPGYPLAEILLRMRQEEKALLPPGDFLPIFEHFRMMPLLDRWVVRQVARRLARGSKVPRLSINVSSQTLEDASFPQAFAAELKATGVVPEFVEEQAVLARLKALDVGFAQGFGVYQPQPADAVLGS